MRHGDLIDQLVDERTACLPETGRPLDMMSQLEFRKGGLVHAYFWHVLLLTGLGVVYQSRVGFVKSLCVLSTLPHTDIHPLLPHALHA